MDRERVVLTDSHLQSVASAFTQAEDASIGCFSPEIAALVLRLRPLFYEIIEGGGHGVSNWDNYGCYKCFRAISTLASLFLVSLWLI